jgi:ParB family transcriptional regulator, chromosome partitioning protein
MTRKGGLGKGLDALIPTGNSTTQIQGSAIFVSTDQIIPNPRQPRSQIQDAELGELSASIREHGILQPLLVTFDEKSDHYTLIAGERRLRAAMLAGITSVPVLVREATDEQLLEFALIENIQRADLTPLETAEAYRQLSDEFFLSHDDIALRVGKNRTTITNTLRLLSLSEPVRQALENHQISEGHARALLGLEHPEAQTAALQTLLRLNLNVRQTEELVRRLKGQKPSSHITPGQSPEIKEIEERLRSALGTRVALKHGKKGGRIILYYFSDEELGGLMQQLIKGQ